MPTIKAKLEELFGVDTRSLALFRICLACLVIADLASRFPGIRTYYSDAGVLPRHALLAAYGEGIDPSLHLLGGSVFLQACLFLLAGFFAVCLLVGFKTRLATCLSAFLLLSAQNRQYLLLNGGDQVIYLLLFWGMFLPLEGRYSVDGLIRAGRILTQARIFSPATLALLAQGASIYIFTGILKAAHEDWWNGHAIELALRSEAYTTAAGYWLLQYPRFMQLLSYGVFWGEILAGFLLFMPVRTGFFRVLTFLGLFAMQTGFGLCLELRLFPWASTVALLPFLPSCVWDRTVHGRSRIQKWLSPLAARFTRPQSADSLKVAVAENKPGRILASMLAVFFFFYAAILNVESILPEGRRLMPAPLQGLEAKLRLYQKWGMFSPPGEERWWLVSRGSLAGGEEVDVMRGRVPVNWEKPPSLMSIYGSDFWRTYIERLRIGREAEFFWAPFTGYICREWNGKNSGDAALIHVEFFIVRQLIFPEAADGEPWVEALHQAECQAG